MEDKHETAEDVETTSGDTFISASSDDEQSISRQDGMLLEEPLNEQEIEELIIEFLEVESKAAEAQETLEKESLAKVESEVREELAQTWSGDDLEAAVGDEMTTFREEWETSLDELETESAHLLEQLDGAGIGLPGIYKWIESQASDVCYTETWKSRIHWAGCRVTDETVKSVANADKYLQFRWPVRRRHGKLLEEGASGFLQKKFSVDASWDTIGVREDTNCASLKTMFSGSVSDGTASFSSKSWASVYLANDPQEAAVLGLKFPGACEVEEIQDIDVNSNDPFLADAMENENNLVLSEESRKNYRQVKEEDDAKIDQKFQHHLKQRRYLKRCKQKDLLAFGELKERDAALPRHDHCSLVSKEKTHTHGEEEASDFNSDFSCHNPKKDVLENCVAGKGTDREKTFCNDSSISSESSMSDMNGHVTQKRSNEIEDINVKNKKVKAVQLSGVDDDGDDFRDQKTTAQGSYCHSDSNCHPLGSPHVPLLCTACDKVIVDAYSHPLLKVIICKDCKCLIEEMRHAKDTDCYECYCGWCGQRNDLLSCNSCITLFCSTCIKRNIGEECLFKARTSGWKCCYCSPNLVQPLISELERAMKSTDILLSSSESDSETCIDRGLEVSSRIKMKKKIRRILDDAELGEDTKRKIAIEKERQERLKSLQMLFSEKNNLRSCGSWNGNIVEGGSAEVHGDASTGYVVNVVRERGEEAVRIPPSLSAKLKAHQVAGIRFLWENVIQSVNKAKSGDRGLGCILAHTMGLGKTFQVISFLYTAMRSIDLGLRTALIVSPVNVLHNWRCEFNKWKPSDVKSLRVFMLEDVPRDQRAALLHKWSTKGGVFLVGYPTFRNLYLGKNVKDLNMARKVLFALQDGPDILVCDEAHVIKNTKADTTQALKQVRCQRRIALTGSPLQNNLMEYYCMVDFVREGFLGSSQEFRNRFQNPIENGQHTNSTAHDVKIMNQRSHILYEQLKGFVQRMDMNVVKKDLPPKTVFVISVKLSPLQRKLYKRFLDVHGFTDLKVPNEKIRKCFFAGYQALAQIWNHPGILKMRKDRDYLVIEDNIENFSVDDCSSDDNVDYAAVTTEKPGNANDLMQRKRDDRFFRKGWWNGLLHESNYKELTYSGKMVLLLDILSMSSAVGDKVLVFSQSIPTLDLIEFYLSRLPRLEKIKKLWKKGRDWYRIDGRTESSERQKIVNKFNDSENLRVKCTLISTRAGSLGINLHSANRVVIVDGSWNPTYDLQAIYRSWRYGQTKPVFAYRFLAHGTMEEKIYKRQVTKEGLAARVVDRQQVHRTMSREEMLHLFDFGFDENSETQAEQGESSKQADDNHKIISEPEPDASQQQALLSPAGTGCKSDSLMESLLLKHHPRWISNFHEHETLLQENEEDRLTKEEQDMAWEVYKRSLEWEEVQRLVSASHSPCDPMPPPQSNPEPLQCATATPKVAIASKGGILRSHAVSRKCTKLSHLLTLRSQAVKAGSTTICGECAQGISWDDLNNDDKKP